MALRTVQPRKPKTRKPAPGQRTASPSTQPSKPALLSSLTNLATLSGGTQPGTGQAGQGQQDGPAPWESDPVLQQIKSMQQANMAAAEAQAMAARQQALINFGYSSQLGSLYGDAGTQGAAQANPFSVLKQLDERHKLRQKGLNEALNRSNLFYSSTRGEQLGQEGQQFLGEQYQAGQKLQSLLGQINQGKLGAQQSGQAAITQGTEDAYTRWLNQQLQYGLGGGGGSGTTHRAVVSHVNRAQMRTNLLRRRP